MSDRDSATPISDVADDLNDLYIQDHAPQTPADGTAVSEKEDLQLYSTDQGAQPGAEQPLNDAFATSNADDDDISTASPSHSAGLPLTPTSVNGLDAHDKHIFVFSSAGKPIFSYRGNEEDLGELTATAEAIMSVVQSKKQNLSYLRSGKNVTVFLDKGPICLVGFSSLAEPPAVLRMQLALVHGQITSLLTGSALAAVFKRNPSYDARGLLTGCDGMLKNLIDSFTASPAALLGAYSSIPILAGVRSAMQDSLSRTIKAAGAVFGLIINQNAVVCVASSQGLRRQPLIQWDILLLLNFITSNEASFKHGEAFTPFCLPNYNSQGHLHAYIHYMSDSGGSTAVVLLIAGQHPDFPAISLARQTLQNELQDNGALQALNEDPIITLDPRKLPTSIGGGVLGTSPLIHFVYKLTSCQQFVAAPCTHIEPLQGLQQEIIIAYSQMRASMFDHAGERLMGPLQNLRYEARERFVLMACATPESELYLVLDALTAKEEAIRLCSRLHGWLQQQHKELFQLYK